MFFTGVTILVFSFLINDILFKFTWIEIVYTESTVIFCVISYFIGMCLQEISSLLYKYLFKNDRLLKSVFNTTKNAGYYITKNEVEKLKSLIYEKEGRKNEIDEVFIYNYCKFCTFKLGKNTRANLDQTIAGLSRSLSLCFFITTVAMIISGFVYDIKICAIAGGVSIFLSVLLFYRYVRFTKMRYTYILRTYLYGCLDKE